MSASVVMREYYGSEHDPAEAEEPENEIVNEGVNDALNDTANAAQKEAVDASEREARLHAAIDAQAHLHHAYLIGLQLMVSSREGPAVVGDWMFRLFRRQHHEKFVSSFAKLGLQDLPHAVACARYHVLSNAIGGVAVEYMEEGPRKAWVRFRYPRWMYAGPAICGVPVEASRGFLRGWYAHNGVSLGNPRLRFVCVSEDMTGEFGFCGYFEECDRDLSEDERLHFANGELPPRFDPDQQPRPPQAQWSEERLRKANRNYAVEYIRNGIVELAEVIGAERTRELGGLAARLVGMQCWRETADMVGTGDGGVEQAGEYLHRMMSGMGDTVGESVKQANGELTLRQRGLRIVRGVQGDERTLLLDCWMQLWVGAVRAHRQLLDADWEAFEEDLIDWTVLPRC
jgi:hypothetical protein